MVVRILVVAPHSDDETLGAGGTLLKAKKEGHEIAWLNVTMAKEEYGYSSEYSANRKKQIKEVIELFEFDRFYNLNCEPAALDMMPEKDLVGGISEVFRDYKPNVVILPYECDVHSDHGIVSRAAYSCTKSFRNPDIKIVLEMEILSETDFTRPDDTFTPNIYVNITDYIEKKIDIMNVYESEIGQPPFPRSSENILALARFRGCSAGYKYAEAFKLIRMRCD